MRGLGPKRRPDDTLPRLLAELQAARREGREFSQAWPAVLAVALRGLSGPSRTTWTAALLQTQRLGGSVVPAAA